MPDYWMRLPAPPPWWWERARVNAGGIYFDPFQTRSLLSKRDQLIEDNRLRTAMLRRNIASRKASRLLLEQLTPAQREQWVNERAFIVRGRKERQYRIRDGVTGNVRLIKAKRPVRVRNDVRVYEGQSLCIHIADPSVPIEDNVLAQKLMIECNERWFLANAHPYPYVAA